MGKIKRIILLFEIKFCKRDYDRFGIEILQNNGFKVEVWDCTPFLHEKFYNEIILPDQISFDGYRIFSDINQVKSELLKLGSSDLVISFIDYRSETYSIYRCISKVNIKYGVWIVGGSYPLPSMVNKRLTAIAFICTKVKKLGKINLGRIKHYIVSRIPFRYLGIRPADFVLAGAANTNFYKFPIGPKSEIIRVHYLDYDIYLNEIHRSYSLNGKSAVFLDEYLPFHPDFSYCSMAAPLKPEDYYPAICEFFNKVEAELGIKIIVAAHPKSNYEDLPDYFEGRQVIRGQTAKLVRESKFVLAHASYSINFAVLFKKPVIFLTLDKLKPSFQGALVDVMSGALNKKAINLNGPYQIDWNTELSIDEQSYEQYKHRYIKMRGTEELPFWQIAANYIKRFD